MDSPAYFYYNQRAVKKKKTIVTPLSAALTYQPVELAFGTSGLRGRVRDMTGIEAWVNTRGFLAWLMERGEITAGATVYAAGDLRPSTTSLVAEEDLRGEILQAACRAAVDAGLTVVFLGYIPTPALVLQAMTHRAPGIMVTGSHIPFDRNGIKLIRPSGEVLKEDEQGILNAIRTVRAAEYARPAGESIFDGRGMLKAEHRFDLPAADPEARERYIARYTQAFPGGALAGRRILVWEHSAVGRDIVASVLAALGAEVVPAGRSDSFVAVDTEAVNDAMLQVIQSLVDGHGGGRIAAVVSTDGDGDRPLVLAVDNGRVRFIPGDLVGLVTADFLGVRHAAVPVSVNDAVDTHCAARGITLVKTRIGSPYLVSAMVEAGWEGNGGFLTKVPLTVPGGGTIAPLPTRDAMLPLLSVLCASLGAGVELPALLDRLPRRFGRSAVMRDFPIDAAREIVRWLSPSDPSILGARFEDGQTLVQDGQDAERQVGAGDEPGTELEGIHARVGRYFTEDDGFPELRKVSWRDGVRLTFGNNDVVHFRPSGNAPEMRLYVNADSESRAARIVEACVADDGLLLRLARDAAERMALDSYGSAPRALRLTGALQHYEWGGYEFIPRLLGQENPGKRPFAELWMGTHPRGTARADIDGTLVPLDRVLARDPWLTLGTDVALRFAGRLPYLFKVLDVRVMASIQAHPSKEQAEEGFARENAAGIAIDAPDRNYRDENHKPEVHVALTDFWMLHGFRPLVEITEVLGSEPELAGLMPGFAGRVAEAGNDPVARSALLRELYAHVMTMAQPQVDALLVPLVARLEAEEAAGRLGRESPGFWALRAARSFPLAGGHRDRGIVSVYLLNLVRLRPGQGTYQPAGTLHAYLEGANVELMANSDNVLRGGLTAKHVDVPELLATLSFRDGRPPILEGRASSGTSREYETPAEEFALDRIEVTQGVPYSGGREHSADTLIVVDGAAAVIAAGRALALPRGAAAIVPAGVSYSIAARSPQAVLFKAGIPSLE
jgi:phosphomannomutase